MKDFYPLIGGLVLIFMSLSNDIILQNLILQVERSILGILGTFGLIDNCQDIKSGRDFILIQRLAEYVNRSFPQSDYTG